MPIDPLTIVFALVAIVVVWKLQSVLGQNSGFQPKARARDPLPRNPPPRDSGSPDNNVVRLPGAAPNPVANPDRWSAFLTPAGDASAGLDAIAAGDPAFSAAPFLDGARTAYEAIVTAFAAGERRTLQTLLSRDVYEGFDAAIVAREKRRETLTTTFVSVDEPRIEAASLAARQARIAVRFVSKQITATRDAGGDLTEGSPDRVVDMDDIWTFARDVGSRDPNWKLVATESAQ